jgi:hypothetical protein
VPAEGIFRLYRPGPDGALTVQTFAATTSPQGYSATSRLLDETIVPQAGQGIPDLLSKRSGRPRAHRWRDSGVQPGAQRVLDG